MLKTIKKIISGIENYYEVLEYLAFRQPGELHASKKRNKCVSFQIEIADQRIFDKKCQIDMRLGAVQKELSVILKELERICDVPQSSAWSIETRKKHHVRKARKMGVIP